jgi:hypothetical protein
MRAIAIVLAALAISGCAANMTKEEVSQPLQIPADAKSQLVINFKGAGKVTGSADWARLKSAWRAALQSEASTYGLAVSEQAGEVRSGTTQGLLVVIDVSDFRYVTESKRASFGFWTGNAWVNAEVTYLDAQTAQQYGERNYNTSSSAWEGVFSAMTDVQVQAIAKDMVDEIRAAKEIPGSSQATVTSSSSAPAQSREQQLEQLNREGLSYEEYQRRYKAITGQ